MRLRTPFCPECGEPANGTVERLAGRAEFDGVPGPGIDVDFSGSTDIWWDGQRTALERDGEPEGPSNRPLVCCANGHEWPTAIDEDRTGAPPSSVARTMIGKNELLARATAFDMGGGVTVEAEAAADGARRWAVRIGGGLVMNADGGWERDASRSEGFIARTRFDMETAWIMALAAVALSNPPEPEHAPESPEPVFSCAECVARMDAVHWRNLGDEGAVVLRALWDGGPGTLGDVLRRARREDPVRPIYRLMQALTTLVAGGLVDVG